MKNKIIASVGLVSLAFMPFFSSANDLAVTYDTALEAQTNVNVNVGAGVQTNARATSSNNGKSDEHPTTTVQTDSGVGGIVSVEAKDVRGWDEDAKVEFMTTLKTALQVQTDNELEHFAQGVMLKNENVESVDVTTSAVEVEYKQPAKFLGMFPGKINAHVVASEDGTVDVKFPWYRFLYRVEKSSQDVDVETTLGAQVSAVVNQMLQTRPQGSANANLTAEQRLQLKAKILETVSAYLEAHAQANASTSASTN